MSPRARRSESITSPPASQRGLIRYEDEKTFTAAQHIIPNDDDLAESDLDAASDDSYDVNDSNNTSKSNSFLIEPHGR